MTEGLKEALKTGIRNAVALVSASGGYLGNARIAIPLPRELEGAAELMRTLGLGHLVDDFITTMNRAAERAAPEATVIFIDAIIDMTLEDAMGVLNGPHDAATAYFKRRTRDALFKAFLPIVSRALDETGVTASYKNIIKIYNGIPGVPRIDFDIDAYVTDRALDGLFVALADEEKKIRTNPAARVTELLKRAFG